MEPVARLPSWLVGDDELHRPALARVAAATLCGLLLGGLLLFVVCGVLSALGFTESYADGHDLMGWPLPLLGAWSLSADLAWLLLSCMVAAWSVRRMARSILAGWDARIGPIALVLAVGWPVIAGWTAAIACVVVIAVVSRVALVPASVSAWRPSRRLAFPGVAILAALALAALSYQPLHPLAIASSDVYASDYRAGTIEVTEVEPRSTGFGFSVENRGVASLRLRAVDVGAGSAIEISGARYIEGTSGSLTAYRPIPGTVLTPGQRLAIDVSRRAGACQPGHAIRVEHVSVRLTTLGLDRTQRFAVETALKIRCG